MTRERAMSEEAAKAMVKALTGKESTKEITKREASQIIDHLNEMGSNEHAHGSQHYQDQDLGLDEAALEQAVPRRHWEN
jgi:phage gp16-like protein